MSGLLNDSTGLKTQGVRRPVGFSCKMSNTLSTTKKHKISRKRLKGIINRQKQPKRDTKRPQSFSRIPRRIKKNTKKFKITTRRLKMITKKHKIATETHRDPRWR